MEPFIKSYQFNYIRNQTFVLINAKATVNDKGVLDALQSLTVEKVFHLFEDINLEQKQIITNVLEIEDKGKAETELAALKSYVVPFVELSDSQIKKLFPKVKKLKTPDIGDIDLKEISYLGWDDHGTNRKYIVTKYEGEIIGIEGTFHPISQKGICTLCNNHDHVGLFTSKTKGSQKDTFVKRGNYICQDSQTCNQHLYSLEKLHDFIGRLIK
ncbi:hypothetical protein HNQ94_001162 [Salirhabdus euzebyi]|uniref:Elongation factor G-binding protein n=1 Tax=Salirhabdus euzebyi TaxID=394506 RepID=A0A841PYH1_9BACI|nr:FusB/FusC family EF-G-binding protein [Salirhabdus euzebyi]MBB6452716.1 hypothetical protein [Salirhabdus euzebyi]